MTTTKLAPVPNHLSEREELIIKHQRRQILRQDQTITELELQQSDNNKTSVRNQKDKKYSNHPVECRLNTSCTDK